MSELILFNKPFNTLCQFTDKSGRQTLADFIDVPHVYPAGLLDYDSEGLVILTADGKLQAKIADPRYKLEKTYWAQVEGEPTEDHLALLREGIILKDKKSKSARKTRPAKVKMISSPPVWERSPPVRFRKSIPTTWLEIKICEGRNRQVRRMTAAIGYPTLRLIRVAIGKWQVARLKSGDWRRVAFTLEGALEK